MIGMSMALAGCVCSAVGLVLMKHSTNTESNKPFHLRTFWWLGFIFLIVNASVIDVVAFSLAPLTLVAPFTGVTIVLTSWLAWSGVLFVKESLDNKDVMSTAVTLFGVLMTTFFGPHVNDAYDTDTLSSALSKFPFHVYSFCALAVLGGGWVLLRAQPDRPLWYRILLYAYTAALCGSTSMLLLKIIGSGLRANIETHAELLTRMWICSLFALVVCAVVQLYFLHSTLANSPVSYGVPTYQTLLTLLTIISGGTFFSEFNEMTLTDFVCFFAGVGIALGGVGLHTQHRKEVEDGATRQKPISTPVQTARPAGLTGTPTTSSAETTKLLQQP